MSRRPASPKGSSEQGKRFVEEAQQLGVDETQEGEREAFRRVGMGPPTSRAASRHWTASSSSTGLVAGATVSVSPTVDDGSPLPDIASGDTIAIEFADNRRAEGRVEGVSATEMTLNVDGRSWRLSLLNSKQRPRVYKFIA